MKIRILILIIILFLRIIIGYSRAISIPENSDLLLSGNISNMYQNGSICIREIGKYLLQTREICAIPYKGKIQAIGRVEYRVIDNLMGKIVLVDGKILKSSEISITEDIVDQFSEWVKNFRTNLLFRLQKFVPEPEAGLLAGIVWGDKNDMGYDFYQRMVNSGTVHIAVASGYNVMLVGGVILAICFWFMKRKWATYLAILLMTFYCLLAGGEAPVVRAGLMSALMYLSLSWGRQTSSLYLLFLACWSMMIWDPGQIREISFQLSMAASAGMVIADPWIHKFIENRSLELAGLASGIGLTTTVGTMLFTLPIIWLNFGRMTLIGILSNILIVPLVPPLMVLTVGLLVFGGVMAWPVYALAHLLVLLINFFAM